MTKQKIADLPQEEREKIIAQMKELHLGGVYTAYTVEKALAAIEKKKAKLANPDAPDDGEQTENGETPEGETPTEGSDESKPDGEQTEDEGDGAENDGDNEPENDENPDEPGNDEQATEETSDVPENPESSNDLPEELDENAKDFLNGKTDKLPAGVEIITEDEAKALQEKAEPAKKNKSEGICHICRSKVFNGVCSGCGFSLRG